MKNNQPITNVEQRFQPGELLISSTDLKGVITDCNDAFVRISGFTRQELIGKSHNIVRHPEMPAAAFQILWETVKNGKPWMGLVKNRCKNGDYYWVDAYVTPITVNGKVVGYESVRREPSRKDVARAERFYQRLNSGATGEGTLSRVLPWLVFGMAFLASIGITTASPYIGAGAFAVLAVAFPLWQQRKYAQGVSRLLNFVPSAFKHPVAIATYTDQKGDLGKLSTAIQSEKSHLNTVLTRIDYAATNLANDVGRSAQLVDGAKNAMYQQNQEIEMMAAAMNQMSTAISQLSANVQGIADRAQQSGSDLNTGVSYSAESKNAIQSLNNQMAQMGQAIERLVSQTSTIVASAQLIEDIAEQTNLLALNAAIEAARAGESGRGFAVVADEVRGLAARTQESTIQIHQAIHEFNASVTECVELTKLGADSTQKGLDSLIATEQVMSSCTDSMDKIVGIAVEMAAAVEQQSHVAEEVNQQVVSIANLSKTSVDSAEAANQESERLFAVTNQLQELVKGFAR
ncbi:methyl-accepting chemotaxis protein [Maribrevibacterium harenarium]|uniref:Methyl-accepting chemotaxis protein n=1 Tax=Maribrevibacterium harenarium TaxID=2589817 RepID=A0A501WGA8_9GAMM|nr:PAS domain-containing methyl-accepting chemotaxis protein [Maribrevibacterium harenarium]TPE47515.1 methyl-accepting chemotaxis protein [Maribrevibacterium harenarium]